MKIDKVYENINNEIRIGDFTIEENNDIIEIYDIDEHSVCWFDKDDLPELITFLQNASIEFNNL